MHLHKDVAYQLELQQRKMERKFFLTIVDINCKLSKIHEIIKPHIQLENYQYATEYIHQYISHTTVWNLKFTMNLDNPEVALLQIFHLNYIFQHESDASFSRERQELFDVAQEFFALNPFEQAHIERRLQNMLEYIQTKNNSQNII